MSENIQIKYLADVPQYIPTLAEWTCEAWGKYDPTLNKVNVTASLNQKLNKDRIPLTFIAIKDNQPVGTVSLKPTIPVDGYSDRDLWLGSFWVIEDYRDQGIGNKLLDEAYAKAKDLGFERISLFASDPKAPKWYANHGWTEFAKDTYQGHEVVLMEYQLK